MKLQPYILGRGASALAFSRCLALLPTVDRELDENVAAPIQLEREASLAQAVAQGPGGAASAILIVANPHGLHAARLCEAQEAGLRGAICEKPVAVSLDEIARLEREVRMPVAVCHGYRMMWGPQTMREEIAAGRIGELHSIEGHYLQSSTAARALSGSGKPGWKNDVALSGSYDCLIDLAPHWADLALFLSGGAGTGGARAKLLSRHLSYANAEAPHRDSGVMIDFEIEAPSRILARSTISKNSHGSGNDLAIRVNGARGSLAWSFCRPDEIERGEGSELHLIRRKDARYGIEASPFHGAGWIEGYFEVTRRFLRSMAGLPAGPAGAAYPTLEESARCMRLLLG